MAEQAKRLVPDRIGHDSEFFLWDTQKQEVVPAHKYYKPADKTRSFTLPLRALKRYPQKPGGWGPIHGGTGGRCKIFRDGVAVEVNVAPAFCRAYLWNDTKHVLLKKDPAKRPEHVVFTSRPVVDVPEEMVKSFPADMQVLGCSPSLDAYTQSRKEIRANPLTVGFRSSGAHLHLSFYDANADSYHRKHSSLPEEMWTPFIKAADILLGVPFTYIFADDLERKRRTLYGQAGEFRFQPSYGGLEYRVLSSRLWNHQAVFSLFAGLWRYWVGHYYERFAAVLKPEWDDQVRRAINECDVALCEKLLGPDGPFATLRAALPAPTAYTSVNYARMDHLHIFQVMRKLAQEGGFPDAGIWSRPYCPEGHKGFTEYWHDVWDAGTRLHTAKEYGIAQGY